MTKYELKEIIKETMSEMDMEKEVAIESLSAEDQLAIYKMIAESYEDIDDIEESTESLEEGAASETKSDIKLYTKLYRAECRKFRKAYYIKKDIEAAKESCGKLESIISDFEKEINAINISDYEYAFDRITHTIKTLVSITITYHIFGTGVIGVLIGAPQVIGQMLNTIHDIKTIVKAAKGELSEADKKQIKDKMYSWKAKAKEIISELKRDLKARKAKLK